MKKSWDRIVIGAGAAGLMCAATAGYRGESVLVLDHANKPGKKILMSGGGRCNFTNLNCTAANFFSSNPHFCKSALARYRPQDFLELVERHGIEWVEKAPGQLFCKNSARDILDMLLTECEWAGASIELNTQIKKVALKGQVFQLETSAGKLETGKLVVATGGLSIPTMGATGFGYEVARQFGLQVLDTRAALVPLTFTSQWGERFAALSGVSAPAIVQAGSHPYNEPILFTHRGLSGPGILQASTHWREGDEILLDLMPGADAAASLQQAREAFPRIKLSSWLAEQLPSRLAASFLDWFDLPDKQLANLSNDEVKQLQTALNNWRLKPAGTEGWRTAEVTLGGVATDLISQRDFSVADVPGLTFIGEVLDVTGELGGHNFQWAWASGYACGSC